MIYGKLIKSSHADKKYETCEFKCKYCDIEYESLCCKKSYQHQFDEKLKKQFFNTYKFSNHNNYLLL